MSIHIYLHTPYAHCVVFALLFLLHKTIHRDCSVNGVLPYHTKQWVLPTGEILVKNKRQMERPLSHKQLSCVLRGADQLPSLHVFDIANQGLISPRKFLARTGTACK